MEWNSATPDELRLFLKDHILPRIDQLEGEVTFLRNVCWPVCQGIAENGQQLSHMNFKSAFLRGLHESDIEFLLKRKSQYIKRMNLGSGECTVEEHRQLNMCMRDKQV
jgi:hypothetical protein